MWVDVVTAASTAAAAIAAAWAAIAATQVARTDRRQGYRLWQLDQSIQRFESVQQLLVAFDTHAQLQPRPLERLTPEEWAALGPNEGEDQPVRASEDVRKQAEAGFVSRLRASTETLPLTRQICFNHIKPSKEELMEALDKFVRRLGMVGDAELEDIPFLAVRGELLFLLSDLRQDLDGQRRRLAASAGESEDSQVSSPSD